MQIIYLILMDKLKRLLYSFSCTFSYYRDLRLRVSNEDKLALATQILGMIVFGFALFVILKFELLPDSVKFSKSISPVVGNNLVRRLLLEDSANEVENQLKQLEFINNITNSYIGEWQSSIKTDLFTNNYGVAYLEFSRLKEVTLAEELKIGAKVLIIDGMYKDISMEFSFNFTISNISSNEDHEELKEEIDINKKTSNILEDISNSLCEGTSAAITFFHKPSVIKKKLEPNKHIEFSEVSISFKSGLPSDADGANSADSSKAYIDKECQFGLDLEFKIKQEEDESYRVWNYSFIITLFSIFEIKATFDLFNQVIENTQIGINLCLMTISVNIVWNSIVSIFHFFLTVYRPETSYEYGLPFITYFILFSVVELRLLFFSWKSRYAELQYSNNRLFKTKMMQFYCLFYLFLFLSLVLIKYLYTENIMFFMTFASTWLFQIIHSAQLKTKPSQKLSYLMIITCAKAFYPVSLKYLFLIQRPIISDALGIFHSFNHDTLC